MFRLLPYIYIICNNACDTEPQTIRKSTYNKSFMSYLPAEILHIGYEKSPVHGINIITYNIVAEIEIVISQSIKIETHGVKGFSHRMAGKLLWILQIVCYKRSTLEAVSSVHDKYLFFNLHFRFSKKPLVFVNAYGSVYFRSISHQTAIFHGYFSISFLYIPGNI